MGALTALNRNLDRIWTRSAKIRRAEPKSRENEQHTAQLFFIYSSPYFYYSNKHNAKCINTAIVHEDETRTAVVDAIGGLYMLCMGYHTRDIEPSNERAASTETQIQYNILPSINKETRRKCHAFHTTPLAHLAGGPLLRLNHLYIRALFYELAVVAELNKPSVLVGFKTSARQVWPGGVAAGVGGGGEVKPPPTAKRSMSERQHTHVHKREQQQRKKTTPAFAFLTIA